MVKTHELPIFPSNKKNKTYIGSLPRMQIKKIKN